MPLETFIFRIASALVAGIIIGTQRELRQRQAGLTTNSLVAIGACIFILISESVIMRAQAAGGPVNNDNLRVLSQVVTGIGFLGAGVIMKNGLTIHGLSSAATIWCSAAVGCLCGYGMWVEALIAVTVIILINWGLKSIEIYIKHLRHGDPQDDDNDKDIAA